MAVAFDNVASTNSFGATSLTTPAFTISGENRAGMLQLYVTEENTSGLSGSIGGVSASAITGADTTTGNPNGRCLCWGAANPATGSQTGTMSWTSASTACGLGALTATGVDQTTPFNNGNQVTTDANPASVDLVITSVSGDLTATVANNTNSLTGTNQTIKWGPSVLGAGDIGPGTGTTTHTWSGNAFNWFLAGANFKATAAGRGRLMSHTRNRLVYAG